VQTDLLTTSTKEKHAVAVASAVALLKKGQIVALPTETVYGLAADALNPLAVVKIFEAKGRPLFDPLIVHLPSHDSLEQIADLPEQDRQLILKLAAKFWPGPFTMVLPKREIVPEIVTAGLNTVAVRISAHPVFDEVVRALGKPLAAPSANRFGRISPTTAQHAFDELSGQIPLVIDAGPTTHGIESTIVAIRQGKIDILRRGPITSEQLRGMGFQPMDPHAPVSIRLGAYLPHWTQSDATYAVTFRLADSLPNEVLAGWEAERRDIILTARQQERELTDMERSRLAKLFSEKIESYLDAGHGECWLSDERVAQVTRDALLHFEPERYELTSWCIMPNHVHVIVRPKPGNPLSEILHSWKSFTAKKANRLLNRKGPFWQAESYDHLIRTEQELHNQVEYVLNNPDVAGLKSWQWRGTRLPPASHRQDADATKISAPGQLPSHYAPKTPLRIVDDLESFKSNERCALLAWNPIKKDKRFVAVRRLSEQNDLREAAANLFCYLRELDALDVDLIVAEPVPEKGLGAAIMDRLRRAGGGDAFVG
jgi:tRNA threonylcarbamoyl adenosine modification protein (Sua5/YciO/YrdC/YwlC family)